jgi:hypothetical protein
VIDPWATSKHQTISEARLQQWPEDGDLLDLVPARPGASEPRPGNQTEERMTKQNWFKEEEFDVAVKDCKLAVMMLDEFAKLFTVGQQDSHRNKTKFQDGLPSIRQFIPQLSNNHKSKLYSEYCRLALVQYKTWDLEWRLQQCIRW